MLTLALVVGHRWVKNMNQGTEGSEVDDLLQLSYLQRLARQKVAEMEVPLLYPSIVPNSCSACPVQVYNANLPAVSRRFCTCRLHIILFYTE